ncbi:MAG: YjbH domain-containing protein [Abyssibacter sp.]|nr:YjbH domain-containing protein [Abyssibacter sp.]MCK5857902.1 YjbH domain-containing protein [Abyssibacter sp.]
MCLIGLLVSGAASADAWLNQYGQVGLMQVPTARGIGKGGVGVGYTQFEPYWSYLFHVQPLDWIQGNFRYIDIRNRQGQANPQGQTFTDKGIDLQMRLIAESDYLPQVAVGLIDLGGTGLFSSEYVVASRRHYDFDFHLGLGWGRLGSRGDFENPIGVVADRFENRPAPGVDNINETGRFEVGKWFRGDVAVFGGVVWNPDRGPLSLFAEVEGNDYQSEGLNNNQETSSRVNLGANYRLWDAVDLGLSWQRGEIVAFSATTHGTFEESPVPKTQQPAQPNIPVYAQSDRGMPGRKLAPPTVARLTRELSRQGVYLHAVDDHDGSDRITVWFGQAIDDSLAPAASRIARSLIRHTGSAYDDFELVDVTGGNESARFVMPRRAYHRAVAGDGSIEEFLEYLRIRQPQPAGYGRAEYRRLLAYPAYSYGLAPQVRSNIGGVDQFAVGQVLLRGFGTLQLTNRWSFTGAAAVNAVDNVGDRLGTQFPSGLPRVRSDIGLYQRTGQDYYLAQLETNYIFPIASDLYGRFSAGIFEEMYGGVASEILYRPTDKRWAVGLDINQVRQRDFDQRFSFRDYEVTTGHLTYYHELPWENVRLIASAGRYLAGDIGVTLDLSRQFGSGVRFGVFATQTDVSAEDFGEGSFDKGFYLSIPFDLFTARTAKSATTFVFRPLLRDGGQKVTAGRSLYDTIQYSHARTLRNDPGAWRQ